MPNPAAVAYEAYRKAMHKDKTRSTFLLSWEYLSETEQKAWFAVVQSISEIIEEGRKAK